MTPAEATGPDPGISRWWRVVGGMSMNLALGLPLCLERVRRPAGKGVRVEARGHVLGLHVGHRRVRPELRRGRAPSGQARSVPRVLDRFDPADGRVPALLLDQQPDLSHRLFRRAGRNRQRVRVCYAYPGHGEVVPRQTRAGRRPRRRRLRRRVGHLRPVGQSLAHSGLRLAHHIHRAGAGVLRDDDDRRVPAEEPAGRLPPARAGRRPARPRQARRPTSSRPDRCGAPRLLTSCGSPTRWDARRARWSSASWCRSPRA